MKTKMQLITELKLQYPTLKIGSDEQGYESLSEIEYETTIEKWADAQLAAVEFANEVEAAKTAKIDAIDKLTALGIDPKALGL
jgi:hypothetical protein